MSIAGLFSGLALANAGLGAVHGIAGPLGGMHPAPHGAVCARLLPIVMEANVEALRKRDRRSPTLIRYRRVAGILTGSEAATIDDGIQWLQDLGRDLKIQPLSRYGLSADHIPDLVDRAQKASSMKGNPVLLTESELVQIIEKAIH
jgi:alcohol dehydrogenase class IV